MLVRRISIVSARTVAGRGQDGAYGSSMESPNAPRTAMDAPRAMIFSLKNLQVEYQSFDQLSVSQ